MTQRRLMNHSMTDFPTGVVSTGVRCLIASLTIFTALGCGSALSDRTPGESTTSKAKSHSSGTAAAGSSRLRTLFTVPDFDLTDQQGQPFPSSELQGHVWIANFIFTRCNATCPRQTDQIAAIQRHVQRWPDKDRLRYVSFTVDPEFDTPEKLAEYASQHHVEGVQSKFLTGAHDRLYELSKSGFKMPVYSTPDDPNSLITHSSKFILIDRQMRARGLYDSLADADFQKLLLDLRTLLSESESGSSEFVDIASPPELFDTPWLEQRRAAQLATADQIQSFHDFHFTDEIEPSGIRFLSRVVSDASKDAKLNHYDHGCGLAVADIDGDGLLDLYFVNQVGGNELWRNLGDSRFEDITEQAGVALADRVGVAASFADVDNDGDADLYVTTTRSGNALFQNDGHGHFQNITESAGLTYLGHSSSADFFDYDRDGWLDLFITNVGSFTTDEVGYSPDKDGKLHPYFVGSKVAFTGHLYPNKKERSILYHNEGGGKFRDASVEMNLVHDAWSGEATPIDANGDGWIDLYITSMQGNDDYYENVGGRRFERKGSTVFPRSVWGGMSVKSADFNNDGRMDLYITNMHADMWKVFGSGPEESQKPPSDAVPPERYLKSRTPGANIFGNALYLNEGGGKFHEVADQFHAENYWPWGLSVGDLNADGFQDAFVSRSMNLGYRYQPNAILLNDAGKQFQDAEFILGVEPRRDRQTATPWFQFDREGSDAGNGLWKAIKGKAVVWAALGTRSAAICDLDNDGDLDIVTNDFNSRPMLLRSHLAEQHAGLNFIQIDLRGTKSNRDGLGAKVQVVTPDNTLTQVQDGQSGYLSQSTLPLYFGLGTASTIERIEVTWPSGKMQQIAGPFLSNQRVLIDEDTGMTHDDQHKRGS